MKVRTRIAPSPTGYLHIGTARTALFNWLFARKNGGEFILRIEDTDLERSDKKYEQDIIEGLRWLGLDWSGEIHRQSERLGIYRGYLEKMLSSGKAFWCHHTKEELEEEGNQQKINKEAPRHLCDHKDKNLEAKEGGIIRLKVDTGLNKKRSFTDMIRGEIEWSESLLGDISLAKNLDTPLYNLAVVVDDIEMHISHVIRGEDHISNTPKQILIYEALGEEIPNFAHLPLILAPDRSKLSKRHGATSVSDFKKDYLPEAMINFMGFIGYTYSKEIMSKEEMAQELEIEKVHKSGAIFDVKKLNWINSQYIRSLPAKDFKNLANISDLPDEAVPLVTDRLEKLTDVSEFEYLWKDPSHVKEMLAWKKSTLEKSVETLAETKKIIDLFDFKDGKDEFRKILDSFSSKVGDRGLVYWPLRVALTGRDKSPDPIDVLFILGKEKSINRIENALKIS